MRGHMLYDGSIIQDNVPLGQGYGIQDQCAIRIRPRGELPTPIFHSCPASSSDVRRIDEPEKGVRETTYRAVLDPGAAQSPIAEEEGKYRHGT